MAETNTATTASSVEIRPAWRREDPELERDVIAFWRQLEILPPGVAPEARAKELCCLGYVGGEVVAVSTAVIEVLPFLRARFALLRIAVNPAHRRRHLAVEIAKASRNVLEQWSLEAPQEKVQGMAAVIQAATLDELKRLPQWPRSGLNLVGYTQDGQQIRVAWFDHARLD
jgi:hypothetical protein